MRGRLLRKNVMKDYFIRTYAVALVIIAFLLFLDTVVFIMARGVLLSGESFRVWVVLLTRWPQQSKTFRMKLKLMPRRMASEKIPSSSQEWTRVIRLKSPSP